MMKKYRTASHSTPGKTSQALVIGGSIAGLLAARVLADHFEQVTIIERDRFPGEPGPRKGIPQARHVHALLTRGHAILEQLFPGIDAQLAAAGAPRVDWGADVAWFGRQGWGVRFQSGIASRACSRDLLEWLVRSRLAANPRVRFRQGSEVVGLLASPDQTVVTGVQVRDRDRSGGKSEQEEALLASLVVDASGRSSRAPQWLEALGRTLPAETIINAYLGYASRWYRIPPNSSVDWKVLIVRAEPPDRTRGGVIFQVDAERWVVTLSGVGRDYPPTDEPGFLEFARSLPTPELYEAITAAEPLTPVYGYQRNENRLRHFERMADWPDGFVALGDAVCAFNPVYGQGMSVAALGAQTLDACLHSRPPGVAGLAKRFQVQLARVNQTPWLLATGVDFRWPATEANRPGRSSRAIQWYVDQVVSLAILDPGALQAFINVTHLLKPPATFFHPRIAVKVLAHALKIRAVAPPQPALPLESAVKASRQ
jgi:2-polyprenyl-6-methoxyphenol hydroxylase-like FAD-dependent oxidoreductase